MKCTRNLKLWHTTIINFDGVAAKRTFKNKSQNSNSKTNNQIQKQEPKLNTHFGIQKINDKIKYIKKNVQVSAKKKQQHIKSLVRFSAASNNNNNILYIYINNLRNVMKMIFGF